jgi:hypothetical protein
MHEGDAAASGSGPRSLVDEAISGGAARGKSRIEVGHPIADVVNSRPPFGQKPGDRTVGVAWGQQLHLGLAERQGHDGRSVGGFGMMGLKTEHVTIEGERRAEVRHGDPDMSDAGEIRQAAPPDE